MNIHSMKAPTRMHKLMHELISFFTSYWMTWFFGSMPGFSFNVKMSVVVSFGTEGVLKIREYIILHSGSTSSKWKYYAKLRREIWPCCSDWYAFVSNNHQARVKLFAPHPACNTAHYWHFVPQNASMPGSITEHLSVWIVDGPFLCACHNV